MAIPVVARGGNCTASAVTAISPSIMARFSMANRRRWSGSCTFWSVWPKATARVFEVDPHTVLQWLVEAAEPLRAFSASFLCDLHVEQLQLDELYAVLHDLKAGEISHDE